MRSLLLSSLVLLGLMGARCQPPPPPPPEPVCPTECGEWCALRECEIPDGCENPGCRCAMRPCEPAPCTTEECGPRPGMPNHLCDDGVTVAGPGECVRNDDGSCGWQIVECPVVCPSGCGEWCAAAMDCTLPDGCENPGCECPERDCTPCTERECGPRPLAPNVLCDDGVSVSGPGDCARNADGSCGWQWLTCPEACGANFCGDGMYCCNRSCGICAPEGGFCTQQACAITDQ